MRQLEMNRIILSLDNVNFYNITKFLSYLSVKKLPIWGVKVKPTILSEISNISSILKKHSLKLMVDAKLFDTRVAMEEQLDFYIYRVKADIVTVHVSSCFNPVNKDLLNYIAGVTVLTTFDDILCQKIYRNKVQTTVDSFVKEAESIGYKYLVCSANDLLKVNYHNIKPICPGIRPIWYKKGDDQVRVATPKKAVENGAEHLVIGRPFIQYQDNVQRMFEVIENENRSLSSTLNY